MEPTGADHSTRDRIQPPVGTDWAGGHGSRTARAGVAPPFFASEKPGLTRPARDSASGASGAGASESAVDTDAAASSDFPWEGEAPGEAAAAELLLTDVLEPTTGGLQFVSEAESYTEVTSIGDFEALPQPRPREQTGFPEDAFFVPEGATPTAHATEDDASAPDRDAAVETADELERLAARLRIHGLEALKEALHGDDRLQAAVAAVLAAYRAGGRGDR